MSTFFLQRARLPGFLFVILFCSFLWASDCSQRLSEALTHFEYGRFGLVFELLEPCRDHEADRQLLLSIQELWARTCLAEDRVDDAVASLEQILLLDPDFKPATGVSHAFRQLLQSVSDRLEARVRVTSVSKINEPLREAPATVVVIERAEMLARGYRDLVEVLADLPGFDLAIGSGDLYANFNQRGYRSNNDRMLFLVDGVEANDLWRGVADISRQYALSNIDRLEVVYGPASTMYGSHAFVGVIQIITRESAAVVDEDHQFGADLFLGKGHFDTSYADATLSWRHPHRPVSASLTFRLYRSDEQDLGDQEYWDYDPAYYDSRDYGSILGTSDPDLIELARHLDQEAIEQGLFGQGTRYSDLTDDWFLEGKARIKDLQLGFQTWERREGNSSWYSDDFYGPANFGTQWVPRQRLLWLKYRTRLSHRVSMGFFVRFKRHSLGKNTNEIQVFNYHSGDLRLEHLSQDPPVRPYWRRLNYQQSSQQLRVEADMIYQPNSRFSMVAGAEVRQSQLQGNYLFAVDCPALPDETCPFGNFAEDRGQSFQEDDAGLFVQGTLRFMPNWKLILGGRWDHNQAGLSAGTFPIPDHSDLAEPKGYGDVYNTRLALTRVTPKLVLKGIFATAFKNASQWERYATSPGLRDLPNPGLDPEQVENLELGLNWIPFDGLVFQAASWRANYNNGVTPVRVPFGDGSTLQNQSIGSLSIHGSQADLRYDWGRGSLFANYTYTHGHSRKDDSLLLISDIAPHHFNVGLTVPWGSHWMLHTRSNWRDAQRVGKGTTTPGNDLERIDGYLTQHLAVSWRLGSEQGLEAQLQVRNLFDVNYDHAGLSSADGITLATFQPQPGRSVDLRLSFRY